jgi:hypothetical protein
VKIIVKALLIFFCLVVAMSGVLAQNSLVKYDGSTLPAAKIIIESKVIKYTASPEDTVLHAISRNEVGAVLRGDGTIEVIENSVSSAAVPAGRPKLPKSKNNGYDRRNTIGIDIGSTILGAGAIWYERNFADGRLGYQIPLIFAFRNAYMPGMPFSFSPLKIADLVDFGFATGIKLNYLPLRKKVVTPIIGISSMFGYLTHHYTYYYGFQNNAVNEHTITLGAFLHAGVQFRVVRWFIIRFEGGTGYAGGAKKGYSLVGNLGLSAGFRF